jgi:3-phosphoshikimate 1-carboxyvinyltransferase
MDLEIKAQPPFDAVISVPGDKSISHRSVMIGAIASGTTMIENFLPGEDCLSTVSCIRQLGIDVEQLAPTALKVHGRGLSGLCEPADYLQVGNSGTTIRLLSGILAGQDFFSVLTGDASIRRRPMARIANPLRQMGASIWGRQNDTLAPLAIKGSHLKAIHYNSPVPAPRSNQPYSWRDYLRRGKQPLPNRLSPATIRKEC